MSRTAQIRRETGETRVELALDLDGSGRSTVDTGVGFFDHMLTLLARHSLIDLTVEAHGDLHVDPHHTVEDVGICLGKALAQALGDKAGVRRYGWATLPMDEVLVTAAVDLLEYQEQQLRELHDLAVGAPGEVGRVLEARPLVLADQLDAVSETRSGAVAVGVDLLRRRPCLHAARSTA